MFVVVPCSLPYLKVYLFFVERVEFVVHVSGDGVRVFITLSKICVNMHP